MTGMPGLVSVTPAVATTPPSVTPIVFALFRSTLSVAVPNASCFALPKLPPDGAASYVVTTKSSFPTGEEAWTAQLRPPGTGWQLAGVKPAVAVASGVVCGP